MARLNYSKQMPITMVVMDDNDQYYNPNIFYLNDLPKSCDFLGQAEIELRGLSLNESKPVKNTLKPSLSFSLA